MRPSALALLAFAAACGPTGSGGRGPSGGGEASLAAAESAAGAVRARLDSMTRVDAALVQGDATSSFSAWFEGGELRAISESLDQGDYGRSEEEYVLVEGRVVYWTARGVRHRPGGGRDSVRWRVALDGAGAVVAAEKLVNGAPEPLEESRAATILSHARDLARAAEAVGR